MMSESTENTDLSLGLLQEIAEVEEGSEQFLTFLLDGEEYGVEILRVQEIKGWDAITCIPNTPEYLCGVLNLRGMIVPIVDLRLRFGMPFSEYTPTTVIVVLRIEGVTERTVGVVVDAVSDTYNVKSEAIQPAPDFGSIINTQYIRGLATLNDNMVMLLDLDSLLDVDAIG
jgi:purine-binding chemotaxis protein CheW